MEQHPKTAESLQSDSASAHDAVADTDGTGRTKPPADARQWPAWYALVTAWVLPATTTRRTAGVSVLRAYLFHLASLVLLVAVVMAMAIRSERVIDPIRAAAFTGPLGKVFGDWWESATSLSPAWNDICIGVAVAEVAFLGLALVSLPFGARVEPMRESVRHALRRTWLHTGHLIPAIVLPWVVILIIGAWADEWEVAARRHLVSQVAQPLVRPIRLNAVEASAYLSTVLDHWTRFDTLPRPWYVRFEREFSSYATAAGCLWFVWALLRGITALRPTPIRETPDLCRRCGYNLTGLPVAGRCPECGHAIADSLPPRVAGGTAWEHRSSLGRWTAFLRTTLRGLFSPRQLASELRLDSPENDHLRFLAWHLILTVMIFSITQAARVLGETSDFNAYNLRRGLYHFLIPGWALVFAGGFLALISLFVLILSVTYCMRDRRNPMRGITQVACYGSGYWSLVMILAYAMVEVWHRWDRDVWVILDFVFSTHALSMTPGFLLKYGGPVLLFLLIAAIGYFRLISRGAAAIRHASR